MNLFVTGIGTDVGKTVVSAVLTEALQADYWKPVQSGTIQGKDSETIRTLISNSKTVIHPETYLLEQPLSPHLAAKLENIEIDLDKINLPVTLNHLIIEGAGGLLVPINKDHYVVNIAQQFNCEIIVVISDYLGCINHSLLTIDYLIRNNFKIKALVFNGEFNEEVKTSIARFKKDIPIIDIPKMQSLTKENILKTAESISYFN